MITTNDQYKKSIGEIYLLMNKGEANLSVSETKKIEKLAKEIEYYEDHVLKLMPMPVKINDVVNQKMEELAITQKSLAEMLGISTPKLSQILNGKRQPDIPFLKAVHKKLGIDGNLILDVL